MNTLYVKKVNERVHRISHRLYNYCIFESTYSGFAFTLQYLGVFDGVKILFNLRNIKNIFTLILTEFI